MHTRAIPTIENEKRKTARDITTYCHEDVYSCGRGVVLLVVLVVVVLRVVVVVGVVVGVVLLVVVGVVGDVRIVVVASKSR